MKSFIFLLITASIITAGISYSQNSPVSYQDPLPDSKFVSRDANIIIRPFSKPSPGIINETGLIKVTGNISGVHNGQVYLSSDGNTVIFKPSLKFDNSEVVFVNVSPSLTKNGSPYSFSFNITKGKPQYEFNSIQSEYDKFNSQTCRFPTAASDSMPPDFPPITIDTNVFPSDGYLFLAHMIFINTSFNPYLMILDNSGLPFFYRKMQHSCCDFKLQPTGNYTYFEYIKNKFYELNKSYQVIDSYYCGYNYLTDAHELWLNPDGTSYLFGTDPQYVNMSEYVEGGDTNAIVIGMIIQKLDHNKQVIFNWRSWDHFEITDGWHENLTAHSIDYVHANALEIDKDGNLLMSSRHLDEITKIDALTGDIIWRFGGKNNQFAFINDPTHFSYQHDIRRLENGNVTLFDNGNFNNPFVSRAVEYHLDEENKTATLVWQYRNVPDVISGFMGNAQRLSNGNTLIGWGGSTPTLTEVTPDGHKTYELHFPFMIYTYRALRYNLSPVTGTAGNNQPVNFNLKQNYPNPFNPSTTIEFSLARTDIVSLRIYDITGKMIKELVNGKLEPNTYKLKWDAAGIPSGTYFYQLKTNGYLQTKKMMLVK